MTQAPPNASQRALRQYIEAIERLEEDKKAVMLEIKDKFDEARGAGFDPKIMRQVIKLRKQSQDERDEAEAVLHTYLHAMQMFDGTPMGEYIAGQEEATLQ